jgi:hypothetical protein
MKRGELTKITEFVILMGWYYFLTTFYFPNKPFCAATAIAAARESTPNLL